MWALTVLLCLLGYPFMTRASVAMHNGSFIPDHVLRVNILPVHSACESQQSIVINGTSPGPLIRLMPGARAWIRVYNDMTHENLTMHWHGLAQRMAPFADGSPMVSQWPIPPGHFFDYEIATEVDDAGTYFYHSHVGMQALSATGPLVVDDCGETPFHYDDERILQFQDYFVKTNHEMVRSSRFPGGWMGETRGILLNGLGVATGRSAAVGPPGGNRGYFGSRLGPHGQSDGHDTSPGSDVSSGTRGEFRVIQVEAPVHCTLPVIDVEPGKTYRFRLIGATGLTYLAMAIEDHSDLTIFQVDGNEYNDPVTTDHVRIGSGQRFDILLQAKTAEELREDGDRMTYFIQFEALHSPDPYRGYAVIRYNADVEVPAAPQDPVLALPDGDEPWLEYTLRPLHPERNQAPSAEEVTRRIIIDCEEKFDNKTKRVVWELAHLSWTESEYRRPALVDIYQRGQAAIPNYDVALGNHG
ncbi:hypothetical protein VTK26DRAFT_3196 [Humicola hyalothermophila]